jgi:hypothetical protein
LPVQVTPQAVQFWAVFKGVQTPEQQPCPVVQAFPQVPQLFVSEDRTTHEPLQFTVPSGQHNPSELKYPLGQHIPEEL